MSRQPKRFRFDWGEGVVEEEIQVEGEWTRPTIQLLRYDDPALGRQVRFCHYDHRGRFQRSPLLVREEDLAALGRALKDAPRLARMLGALRA